MTARELNPIIAPALTCLIADFTRAWTCHEVCDTAMRWSYTMEVLQRHDVVIVPA